MARWGSIVVKLIKYEALRGPLDGGGTLTESCLRCQSAVGHGRRGLGAALPTFEDASVKLEG